MSSPFPCVGGIIAKFIVAAMNQSGGATSGLIRWLSLALYGWKVIQQGRVLLSRTCPIEPLIHIHKSPSSPKQSAAIGRMLRSTTLEPISTRPSSRKRISPSQRDFAIKKSYAIANARALAFSYFDLGTISLLLGWFSAVSALRAY
jgi:hypothetical protein